MTSRIRILIADDHALVRSAFASLLADHEGLEVVGEAEDGQAALEFVARLRPDIVLMDYRMPKLDGPDATEQIASLYPASKVIGLSMSDSDETTARMLAAGAVACLPKTAECTELVALIRESVKCGATS